MPRELTWEGRRISFPDDFTDAEIAEALSPSAPAVATVGPRQSYPQRDYLGEVTKPIGAAASWLWGQVSKPREWVESKVGLGELMSKGASQNAEERNRAQSDWEQANPRGIGIDPIMGPSTQEASRGRRANPEAMGQIGKMAGEWPEDPLAYLGTGLFSAAKKGVGAAGGAVGGLLRGTPPPGPVVAPKALPAAAGPASPGPGFPAKVTPEYLPMPGGGVQATQGPRGYAAPAAGAAMGAAGVGLALGGPDEAEAGGLPKLGGISPALGLAEKAAAEIQAASHAFQGVPGFTSKAVGKMAGFAQDYYTKNPAEWGAGLAPGEQITDRVAQIIKTKGTGPTADPQVQAMLTQWGISGNEAALLLRANVSEAAKVLQSTQTFQLGLKSDKTPFGKELANSLRDLGGVKGDAWTPTGGTNWAQLEGIRRTLMTMQQATVVRQAASNAGRLGLDVIENGLSGLIARAVGKTPVLPPTLGLETVIRALRSKGLAGDIEKLLETFPAERSRLFNIYEYPDAANLPGAAGAISVGLRKAQEAVDVLNVLNRGQEFFFRRAIFATTLDAKLRAAGTTFDEVVKYNNTKMLTDDMLKPAIDRALDLTWAKQPEFGSASYHMIKAINKSGATVLMPFPRFFINSLSFTFEHSPLGVLKLLSPAERAKIAAGDMKLFAKSIEGYGMLGAAYAMRQSMSDEQWNEATRATMAMQPFSAYFFLADAAHKYQNNALHRADLKGMLRSLGEGRAGVGMEVLDSAIASLTGIAAGDKPAAGAGFKQATAEYLGSFTTPMGSIVDYLDQYKQWSGKHALEYDTRGTFSGPLYRNIPGLRESLPPRQIPGRGTLEREAPALRQILGLSLGAKREPLESFMESRGVSVNRIFAPSGLPEWDRAVAEAAYPFMFKLNVLAERPDFTAKPPAVQGMIMQRELTAAHAKAAELATKMNPWLAQQAQVQRMPPEEIQAVKDTYGFVTPQTIRMFRQQMQRR